MQVVSAGEADLAALAKPAAGAEPGWMTRITAWASKPALGAERVERMVDWVRWNGLRAQIGRPVFQTAQGLYTGLSAGQTGARLVAGREPQVAPERAHQSRNGRLSPCSRAQSIAMP